MEKLINNVDAIILTFVQGSFGNLTGTVLTLWHLMFVIFIAVYGYKTMISGRFSASDLVVHCVKIIVLLILATQWDTFFLFVYHTVTDIPSLLAGQIMQAASSSNIAKTGSEASINTALSQFFDRGMAVASKILQGAGWTSVGQYLYALAVWIGTVGLTAYAFMLIILAKLAVAVLLAVGPLFILLLMFTNTKSLFDGWLRTLLNYALIPIFVYTLLAILLTLAESPLQYLESGSGVNNEMMTHVAPFLLITLISILLLAQVLNIAASVTGGVSLSTIGAARWTSRTLVTGPGGTITSAAGQWSWRKTGPARRYAASAVKSGARNTAKAGRALLTHALNRRTEMN